MLRRALFGLIAVLFASPALAFNFCHESWFTRNLIFDRAGYCFGSVLGQSVFDNSNCTGTSVEIGPAWKQIVANLRAEEQRIGCQLDTSRAAPLDIPNFAFRMRQTWIPIPDHLGFGCMGWRGGAVPLFAQADGSGGLITTLQPGDDVLVFHYGVDQVTFLTVDRAGVTLQGWSGAAALNAQTCTQMAG